MTDLAALKDNVDADDGFRYAIGRGKPSSLFRNASFLLIPLAVYQIVYTFVGNDPFFTRNLINSIISLLVSLIVIAWASLSVSKQDDILTLKRHYNEGLLSSQNVFITLALTLVQHIVCIFELSVTRSWVNDNLQATLTGDALTQQIRNEARYQQFNLIAQVIITLYFICAARLSFKTLDNEDATVSYTLGASTVIVSIASFALLYFNGHADYFVNIPDIASVYQPWLLGWLFGLTIVFLVIAAAAWVINHQQWRAIVPPLWVTILVLLFVSIPLAGRSYQNTADVHQEWSGEKGNWVNRLANVSESYLKGEGCPAKYYDGNSCGYSTSVYPWENNANPRSGYSRCINQACLGILGQIYAQDFLLVSRTFAYAVAGIFLLLLCISYLWHHGANLELKGNPKNSAFAGGIGLVLVVFLVLQFAYVAPIPETYSGDANTLRYSNYIAAHPSLHLITKFQAVDDFNFEISEELNDLLFEFILFQSHKYLVLQLTEQLDNVILTRIGDVGNYYDSFYRDLSSLDHSIGLIWIEVEDQLRLIVTFYVGPKAPATLSMVYHELDGRRDEFQDDDGVGLVLTNDAQDLILENVLQAHLRIFNTRGEASVFGYVDVPRFNSSYPGSAAYDNRNILLPEEFEYDINDAVNSIRRDGGNNFVAAIWDGSHWELGKETRIEFTELRESIISEGIDQAVLFFYDFVYENQAQLVGILYGAEYIDDDQAKSLLRFIKSLNEVAIPFYPLIDPDFFDLDYLINFGCVPDPEVRIETNNRFISDIEDYLD